MKDPKGKNLYAVRDARHIITRSGKEAMSLGAIAVIPRPDRRPNTLAKDVLRAIGKTGRRRELVAEGNSPMATACAWLDASDTQDLLIYDADWLDDRDIQSISELSEATRVWLLFDGEPNADLIRTLCVSSDVVSPSSLEYLVKQQRHRHVEHWRDFPRVPLACAITFRGRCVPLFDSIELGRIDSLLEAGASAALDLFRRDEVTTANLTQLVLAPKHPVWPALCYLRGAQLATLLRGCRLEVDTDAWLEFKYSRPDLTPSVREALLAQSDPRDAVLLTIAAISNANAADIAALNFDSVEEDRAAVFIGGQSFEVPEDLQPAFTAFFTLAHADSLPHDPLFSVRTGRRMTSTRVRELCRGAAFNSAAGGSLEGQRIQMASAAARGLPFIELREMGGVRGSAAAS